MATNSLRASIKTALLRTVAASALVAIAGLGSSQAFAQSTLPAGGTVTSGAATISGGGGSLTIDQSSAKAIVNWQSFDVGAGNSVVFHQPDANSATLNRVTGGTSSTIAGQIVANGSVYLVNPNGIAITSKGSVQTGGGFVASTLDLADGDFTAGKLAFTGRGAGGRVSNAGSISVGTGGYVALLGGQVSNTGTISVPLGKVALGAGEAATLDLNGDGFLQVAAPTALLATGTASGDRVAMSVGAVRDAVRGLVNVPASLMAQSAVGSDGAITLAGLANSGSISASGGSVALTSAGTLSHTGTIDTDSASGNGGRIVLLGDSVAASGTLSARATGASGNGGFVETSGRAVDFTGAKVDTSAAHGAGGTWLVDPEDLVIDATAAAAISSNLASTGVTLQTTSTTASTTPAGLVPGTPGGNGDITINSAISWTSANTLTLLAYNNIAINAGITGTSGGLTLTAGNNVPVTGAITASGNVNVGTFNLTNGNWSQIAASLPSFSATDFRTSYANATFLRATGGNGSSSAYQIADVYGLQGMASGALLANSFALANDINASGTSAWNAGAGFVPIGRLASSGPAAFTGTLDGQNHVISGLAITNTVPIYIGMFGLVSGGSISNVGLTGVAITSTDTGAVGGLVGQFNAGGSISNSYVTGSVSITNPGSGRLGGLVGALYGSVSNSYSTATINGFSTTGGLVGNATFGSTITGSYATGTVSGSTQVGGLVGLLNGTLTNSYARGSATSTGLAAGGLVGLVGTSGSIANSYATGDATASRNAGGLAGTANGNSTIVRSYATGNATTTSLTAAGGLVGLMSNTSSVSDVYATGNVVSASGNAGGLVGSTTSTGSIVNAYATGSVRGSSSVGGLVGSATAGTVTSVFASGAVTATGTNPAIGGLIGGSGGTVTNGYWDSYSTGQVNAFGGATPDASITAVSSDPGQSSAATYAYKASAYANLNAATGVGGATPTGFVFAPGNSTRPFLAFEVPTAAQAGVDGLGRVRLANSHQLQLIGYNGATNAASYVLTGNIDLRETGRVQAGSPGSYAGMWSSAGFVPIGTDGSGNVYNDGTNTFDALGIKGFSGTFDGAGLTVSNLTVARSTMLNAGLFGWTTGTLTNVVMTGGTVAGKNNVGALTGYLYLGTVNNVSIAGTTSGSGNVGGVVGLQYKALVTNATSSGAVSGASNIGGVTGFEQSSQITNSTSSASATATRSYAGGLVGYQLNGTANTNVTASGAVSAPAGAGGLVGLSSGFVNAAESSNTATTTNASASGAVSGSSGTGGLIGYLGENASVSQTYATGTVNGSLNAGGLVGYVANASVTDSYATGAVNGATNVGGLVGMLNGAAASVTNTYATGAVTGTTAVGGLIGTTLNTPVVVRSVWDTTTTGQSVSAGGSGAVGYSTAQLQDFTNYVNVFAGWDFATIWLPPNQAGQNGTPAPHYPRLRVRPTP